MQSNSVFLSFFFAPAFAFLHLHWNARMQSGNSKHAKHFQGCYLVIHCILFKHRLRRSQEKVEIICKNSQSWVNKIDRRSPESPPHVYHHCCSVKLHSHTHCIQLLGAPQGRVPLLRGGGVNQTSGQQSRSRVLSVAAEGDKPGSLAADCWLWRSSPQDQLQQLIDSTLTAAVQHCLTLVFISGSGGGRGANRSKWWLKWVLRSSQSVAIWVFLFQFVLLQRCRSEKTTTNQTRYNLMMRVCKMRPLCSPALCKQLDPSIYHVEIIASVINSPLTKQFMVNTRLTSCKLAVIELCISSVECLKAFY